MKVRLGKLVSRVPLFALRFAVEGMTEIELGSRFYKVMR